MLQLSNVGKRYGSVTVLENISFVVNPGDRVGLIGPNGCGKTTLLRIVAGQEQPDVGSVRFSPPTLRLGYLEQGQRHAVGDTLADFLQVGETALEAASARVARLATELAKASSAEQAHLMTAYSEALADLEALAGTQTPLHEVETVLTGLGLGNVSLNTPVANLSGGQKTRLGLARLLTHEPQLLLLDEPTNHLDIEALEWLEAWLRDYAGAALIVSHDRTLLDHTVKEILDLDPETHTVIEYTGNYSAYIETWERDREKQWARWQDQQAEIRRVRRDIEMTKNQALSVELTTTSRQPGVRRIAKKVAKKAKTREGKLERYLESQERVEKPRQTWQMKLAFEDTPESGQDVLVLTDVAVGYGAMPLVSRANQVLRAGERAVMVGPNGTGKTTLLRVIAGQLAPLTGKVRLGTNVRLGYYAQEQETLDPASTPFETIVEVASMSETAIRSFLHYFLFSGDDVFVPVEMLSYGERARLVLARLVATGCNFLLLDEPVNHLDIPSREMFEQAMRAFEGTVLAVVHDRYFIRRFATCIWAIHDGTLRRYLDLDELQRVRSREREWMNTPP
ncbi:MAG: ABC-F family ATP-binding cassette domain-containing protein [Chloroflexota bacterium]|nr:ABC-F family ATP-binding cassette domain-containing protein [Chloroflexota bacterium]